MSRARAVAAIALALAGAPLAASCKSAPPEPCTPDLASIERVVFRPSCALNGCHSANDAAGKLTLTEGEVAKLTGARSSTCEGKLLVAPGDPDASFLVEKITSAKPSCGAHMPSGGDVPEIHKACIRDWIRGLPKTAR